MTDAADFPSWDEVCDRSGTAGTGQAYGLYLIAQELHEQNRLRRLELELERGNATSRDSHERRD